MSDTARHPESDLYGYVRDREDALRRELLKALDRATTPLHERIGKRREELLAFRDTDFATVGEQVAHLAHDLARGAQPGWVDMRITALDAAILHERIERCRALDAASGAAQEDRDELRAALMAQRDTLVWFQRAVFGAMFVALTSLAVQVLLLTKG